MGFYGKVTNVNNTSFSFDKVYPNKFTMMNKCAEDGVFVGRFVLVYCKRLYKKGIEECLYFDSNLSEQTKAIFVEKNTLVSGPYDVYHGELVYIVQYTTQGEPYYVFYVCTGKATDDKQTAIFQPLGAGNNYSNDKYTYNYSIDTGAYGLSKGFDSTVWQKIYQNGNYKYVQVAELNSVIPTFSLLIDPPTQNPIAPYFDKNQTSVYYPLHVQPTWGFWVKEAAKGTASDQRVQHYISQYDANAQAVITKNNWVNGDILLKRAKIKLILLQVNLELLIEILKIHHVLIHQMMCMNLVYVYQIQVIQQLKYMMSLVELMKTIPVVGMTLIILN